MRNTTLICALLLSLPLLASSKVIDLTQEETSLGTSCVKENINQRMREPFDLDIANVLLSLSLPTSFLPVSNQALDTSQYQEKHNIYVETLFDHLKKNKTDLAIALINKGIVPLDVPDQNGLLPIHRVCSGGNIVVVRALISKNPDQTSIRGLRGITPLHAAASGGHVEIMKFLLDAGAHLDARTYDGATAFHFACILGRMNAVEFFLTKKPGMLHETTDLGATGLDFAVKNKQTSMAAFLKKRLRESSQESSCVMPRNVTGEKRSGPQDGEHDKHAKKSVV